MIPNVDETALEAAKKIDDIFVQSHNGVAQRTSRVQIIIRNAIEEHLKQLLMVDINGLIFAAKEFVDKVDRGDAKPTDSYTRFKRALGLSNAKPDQTS